MTDKLDKKNAEISRQIEELIMQAENPKDKAMLMVLNKIANSLDENTDLTRNLTCDLKAHTQAFENHEKAEMALINQGRGFFRASIFALALFQGLFAWYASRHIQDMDGLANRVAQNTKDIEIHKEHHRLEEVARSR